MEEQNISIVSDVIFAIGPIGITNSVLAFWATLLLIFGFVIYIRSHLALVPNRWQVAAEGIVEYLDDLLTQQFSDRRLARRFLPFMVGLFLFILIANQFSVLPLLQSITVSDRPLTYLFRTPTADLGFPFVMAFIVILFGQIIALSTAPLKHIGNYFKIAPLLKARSVSDFFMALVDFFLGLLDIVGEFAKIISLSGRLFGNVLAGELMIIIISGMVAYAVPLPFFALSLLSGIIQTLVFVLLSIGFLSNTINAVEPEGATA